MTVFIHWVLNNRKIDRISFDNGYSPLTFGNVSSFLSCLDDFDFTAPDGFYKAILHIQEGSSFFNIRDVSQTNGNAISIDYRFAQDRLYYQVGAKENLPIIHISAWPLIEDDVTAKFNVHYPRFAYIMDSSIWNYFYYIRLDQGSVDQTGKKTFQILAPKDDEKKHLYWIFNSVSSHLSQGHYNLVVSREYADLNARLVGQSYIAGQDGHSYDVSPFIFHSEWGMEAEWKKNMVRIKERNKNLKWRFLLLDDHAWTSMDKAIADDRFIAVQKNSKLEILAKTIKEMELSVGLGCVVPAETGVDFQPTYSGDFDVELWGVQTIKDAFLALEAKEFDIIFLDYLLGKQHSINDIFGEKYRKQSSREYGYQFLSRLREGQSPNNDIPKFVDGPCGKQYVMFISAFTTAVDERLRSEGLHRIEDKWYIAEGACPTNTPSLFRYYLSRAMERRLEETGILSLSEDNILKMALGIFQERDDNESMGKLASVRRRAYEAYRDILGLHFNYFLLKSEQGKSLLVDSFLSKQVHMGALLEHLLQLVHLTASGTVRQWTEIWEER